MYKKNARKLMKLDLSLEYKDGLTLESLKEKSHVIVSIAFDKIKYL